LHADRYLVGFEPRVKSRYQRIWEGHGIPTLRFELGHCVPAAGDGESEAVAANRKFSPAPVPCPGARRARSAAAGRSARPRGR
jgi:hypothetical protein